MLFAKLAELVFRHGFFSQKTDLWRVYFLVFIIIKLLNPWIVICCGCGRKQCLNLFSKGITYSYTKYEHSRHTSKWHFYKCNIILWMSLSAIEVWKMSTISHYVYFLAEFNEREHSLVWSSFRKILFDFFSSSFLPLFSDSVTFLYLFKGTVCIKYCSNISIIKVVYF